MGRMPKFSTIQLIGERLAKLGYKSKDFRLGGVRFTQFESPSGNIWLTRSLGISYPFNSATSGGVSRYKNQAYDLAARLGIPIPFTEVVGGNIKDSSLRALFKSHNKLIVKPNNSTLSRGLTRDVTTSDKLKRAIKKAQDYSPEALIQEQVRGDELRFVVVGGQVVAAMLRQAPRVVGDGKSTLKQLLDQENEARSKIKLKYIAYPQLTNDIIPLDSLNLSEIPAEGQIVELAKRSMIKDGASVYNVLEDTDMGYIDAAQKLAKEMGDGFMAVDFLIEDYKKPATNKNFAFLEFNMAPVLKLFYGCRDGKIFDVLDHLIPKIDQQLSGQNVSSEVFGAFERVSFPELGVRNILAKVDTGAYSGAVYATDLHAVRGENGKLKGLSFALPGGKTHKHKLKKLRWAPVTSSTGHIVKRYIVDTIIEIKDKVYPITIGLSDRTNLKYPVLIGRRFLRKNNISVDVRINQHLDNREEKT